MVVLSVFFARAWVSGGTGDGVKKVAEVPDTVEQGAFPSSRGRGNNEQYPAAAGVEGEV